MNLNRTELADLFGVSLPTISHWIRLGCPYLKKGSKSSSWGFESSEVLAWYKDKAIFDATSAQPLDEIELKRRKLSAETQKAELELAKAKGEVAPVQEFERAQASAFAEIRTHVMNVPQRTVKQLIGETEEMQWKKTLREELSLALESVMIHAPLTLANATLDTLNFEESPNT